MGCSREKPLLSLMSSYDDLMRAQLTLFDQYTANFDAPVALANDYEITRKKYNMAITELSLKYYENEQLRKKVKVVNYQLDTVRQALTKKVSDYDNLMIEYKKMATKLEVIQTVIFEKEIKKHSSSYDSAKPSSKKFLKEEISSEESSDDSENSFVLNADVDQNQDNIVCSSKNCDHGRQVPKAPKVSVSKTPSLENTAKVKSSQPHSMSKNIKYGFLSNTHSHKLQSKVVRKLNTICAPCGKKINFCSKAIICLSCYTICHQNCQQKLELSCIQQ